MSAVVFIRNILAAVIAVALLWFGDRMLAPLLAQHLPGPEAVWAVLGLTGLLLPIVYKLLGELMTAVRLGAASPARSLFVTVLAGGAVLSLIASAGPFVIGHGLRQAALMARGAPAAESLVRTGALHDHMLTLLAALVAALFIGSWAGRRHGAQATLTVVGFALLGWAMVLGVDILAGVKTAAAVHAALHDVVASVSKGFSGFVPAAKAAELPLLLGAVIFGVIGVYASGGKTGSAAPRALVLGAA